MPRGSGQPGQGTPPDLPTVEPSPGDHGTVTPGSARTPSRLDTLRTILEQRVPGTPEPRPDGTAPWITAVLGALQALVLSLAVVVVPATAMAVAATAQVDGAVAPWGAALGISTRLWLLAHGVPLVAPTATVSLVPLGITIVAGLAAVVSARRSVLPARSSLVVGTAVYTTATVFVAIVAGAVESQQLLGALVGGASVAATGFAAGLLSRPDAVDLRADLRSLVRRLPRSLTAALRGATAATATVVAAASLLVAGWLVAGRSSSREILDALGLDVVSGISLAVAQLALLPDLVVWAVAWLTGPGFAVGSDTHFGPDGVTSAPLPGLPLLGALPGPASGGGPVLWVPLVIVLAGVVGGWCAHRRLASMTLWQVPVLAAVVGVASGTGVGLLVMLGTGSAGPGRLEFVGASAPFVGLCAAGLVGLGALLALLALRHEVRRAVATGWRRLHAWWDARRSSAQGRSSS